MSDVIYTHYGDDEFDLEKFNTYKESIASKPRMGLWGTRDDGISWKDWCKSEEYSLCDISKSFKFKLSPNAKILEVRSEQDIVPYAFRYNQLIYYKGEFGNFYYAIDYNRLLELQE